MVQEEILYELKKGLTSYMPLLGKMADEVVGQGVSVYPIFVAFKGQQEVGLGLPVIQAEEGRLFDWTIHISTLEELASRQVIGMEKVDNFRIIYKDAAEQLCFLVWDAGQASFAFIPRVQQG
jgi:hypothetical protein